MASANCADGQASELKPPVLQAANVEAPAKQRQPRLRASCDGCFLAKVKCSKTRPICSRCLTSGINCQYSPSSRAGKPKPETSNASNVATIQNVQPMHSLMDNETAKFLSTQRIVNQSFPPRGWNTLPTGVDDPMAGHPHLASNLPLIGFDERGLAQPAPISASCPDFYSNQISWDSTGNIPCTGLSEPPAIGTSMPLTYSPHSFHAPMPIWPNPKQHNPVVCRQSNSPPSLGPSYLSSPDTTPILPDTAFHHLEGGSCTCFAACLRSLLDLHNVPVQDAVLIELTLEVSRKALYTCASMIECKACFGPGQTTSTMLLATIFRKVMSFFKNIIFSFNSSDPVAMREAAPNNSLGGGIQAYNEGDERRIKGEYMGPDVEMFNKAFSRFRDVRLNVDNNLTLTNPIIEEIGGNIVTLLQFTGAMVYTEDDPNQTGTPAWGQLKWEASQNHEWTGGFGGA